MFEQRFVVSDELAGFEEQWNKNGRKHLQEMKPGLEMLDNGSTVILYIIFVEMLDNRSTVLFVVMLNNGFEVLSWVCQISGSLTLM